MRIVGIGETLLDVIFRDNQPVSARPGGSVLNSLVSLGRLGLSPVFISDYGTDRVGNLIDTFLRENGVDTTFVEKYEDRNSGLAMAFLDSNMDADYQFYKDYPEERLMNTVFDFDPGDIFLFSSFFAISSPVRTPLLRNLEKARESGSLVIYDPNFRKPHLSQLKDVLPMIEENIMLADIVRGSDEDFRLIFGISDPHEAYQKIASLGCQYLLYTANKKEVHIFMPGPEVIQLKVPEITPISTIGAGDSFNAGLIWSLVSKAVPHDRSLLHSQEFWKYAGKNGINFATEVCLQYDNYISREFAAQTGKGESNP